jgi:hypothetical protein
MPAKIKPIPLRMPDALRAKVQAYAKGRSLSEHAAVVELINKGLRVPAPPPPAPKEVLAQAEAAAAHLAAPKRAAQVESAPKASRWAIPFGPVPSPPGSRLKQPAKRR